MDVYGVLDTPSYRNLVVMISPCNYIAQEKGETLDDIDPECVPDLDAQKAYLGSPVFHMVVNYAEIDPTSYGD